MRTDWTPDATYLAFDVGPLGMGHWHQDKLSFVLWKGNECLVFDDGGGQYEDSRRRRYGLSGYDHNTLLVDGLAQNRLNPRRVTAPIDAGWRSTCGADGPSCDDRFREGAEGKDASVPDGLAARSFFGEIVLGPCESGRLPAQRTARGCSW